MSLWSQLYSHARQ